MNNFIPLVTWIILLFASVHSQYSTNYQTSLKNFRFGSEVFFLNLEDGYFGCQVNESTDYLQLYELSKLCDGIQDCFLGSDELRKELKCTNNCDKDDSFCKNGVCLNGVCHCNDGFGGCNCNVQDENECKHRPCDVFAHCTNTLGSFTCTCFPGYRGNGLQCEDINECEDPVIAARCAENAECCNLPAHYLCKCKDGYEGDGEHLCTDVDECQNPNSCGRFAHCINTPGNYTCQCPEGYYGNPYDGCEDINECLDANVCAPHGICTNLEGGYRCDCPQGFRSSAQDPGLCEDEDECARSPCGRNAQCLNTNGSFKCLCPEGFNIDEAGNCEGICVLDTECASNEICLAGQCKNPCLEERSCGMNAECSVRSHAKYCTCPPDFTGDGAVECIRIPISCSQDTDCNNNNKCVNSVCCPTCHTDTDCVLNEKCIEGSCQLTCRVDNDCFLGHVCLQNRCTYGCHNDDDCAASESCRDGKCKNPCLDSPCGPNADCSVSNHRATCNCYEGMVANPTPQLGCIRSPAVECRENHECPYGLVCLESACRPLCAEDNNCLANERCVQGVCKPACHVDDDCRSGEICQGVTCATGCRSDKACRSEHACVNNQCIDLCLDPAACGVNAHCQMAKHTKQCICPDGLDGDASVMCKKPRIACDNNDDCESRQLCLQGSCKQKCRHDQTCLQDERCVRGVCQNICNSDTACFKGEICENRICQVGCRSDQQCEAHKSCINRKCVDPCERKSEVCGECATCNVVSHSVQCSCPAGYLGDGVSGCQFLLERCHEGCDCDETNTYCSTPCQTSRDCECGKVCVKEKCRVKCNARQGCAVGQICQRGACIAGCKKSADCAADQQCVNSKCVDPCAQANACGRNALCTASNHNALCYCPDGFQGEPDKECVEFECHENKDCEMSKFCDGGKCRNPCLEAGTCGVNAQCRVTNRQAECSCPPDFIGNPEVECHPVVGGCTNNPCGVNAKCLDFPGGFECTCIDGCVGDPHKGCICQDHLVNACADQPCGNNALCRVLEHNEPQCYCPEHAPYGDAYLECHANPTDEDCRLTGCAEGECVLQGNDYRCQKDNEKCLSDSDCPSEKACMRGRCINPCSLRGACGAYALCKTVLHRSHCSCPNCYIGRPEVECKPDPKCTDAISKTAVQEQIPCMTDLECPDTMQCSVYGQCNDPCQNSLFLCENHKKCETRRHRPVCVCKFGFVVNEFGELTCAPDRRECFNDDDCASNMACQDGKCRNPCIVGVGASPICAENKSCEVQNHRPVCICMKDCQPSISICLRDAGCPTGLACRNYQCVNPCDFAKCAPNSPCIVEDHKPICKFCPPGYIADARNGCQKEIGCSSSTECASQLACINSLCVDPCIYSNDCRRDEECHVSNHVAVCSKGCECQNEVGCSAGFRCVNCQCVQAEGPVPGCEHCSTDSRCEPSTGACIRTPAGAPKTPEPCQSNSDCIETESCYLGLCQNPCEFSRACAPTAICTVRMHRPVCTCAEGQEGNPTVKCSPPYQPSECLIDRDCDATETCFNERCVLPCDARNPCAQNAVCINTNHVARCVCADGYEGDGVLGCRLAVSTAVCQYNEDCPNNKFCDRLNRRCLNPCLEDSCGENAECIPVNHGVDCKCLAGFAGNAYVECVRLQGCRSDDECDESEACINGQCRTPCQCGDYALCDVVRHKAVCKCPPGFIGRPEIACSPSTNPCDPNPCGLEALCELDNGNPICYCPKGLTGNPFKNCIPEGDSCPRNQCGPNSDCRIVDGRPICFCLPEYEGQPPQIPCELPSNPCDPSPCGPNTQCTVIKNGFSKCTCLPGYVESPNTIRGCVQMVNLCEPNPCGFGAICDAARSPVCYCPDNKIGNPFKACESKAITLQLCKPGPCGRNADCYINENREDCYCRNGFVGDPYQGCVKPRDTVCDPNACGPNAQCFINEYGKTACICPEGLSGDPTSIAGCYGFQCQADEDCPGDKACLGFKCIDPCPGACGYNALCRCQNHRPQCYCDGGMTGNPNIRCYATGLVREPVSDVCTPQACGQNAECTAIDNRATCSCIPGYFGDPHTACDKECIINSDCVSNLACINHKCVDPCAGTVCGINAICNVQQNTPVCSCLEGYTGDPFMQCVALGILRNATRDPCQPSPCAPGDVCSPLNDLVALCDPCFSVSSQQNPHCRPECISNSDCAFDRACLNQKCQDPCPGSCGLNAVCNVHDHYPICACLPNMVGNPYEQCLPTKVSAPIEPTYGCSELHCGANAVCRENDRALACVCQDGYFGDPYMGCRPECVLNTDCQNNEICYKNKCKDACAGLCGRNSVCRVINHAPLCICADGYSGDAYAACTPYYLPPIEKQNSPCEPNPCGPNSRCRISDNRAVCSCLPNYKGLPPACQPECSISSECALDKACINQRCVDPCPGTCGLSARCEVLAHNPLCSCEPGFEGDPFVSCSRIPQIGTDVVSRKPENPCLPSPCGPNSICQIRQNRPVCSCVENYIGSPPYCRPECTLNSECPFNKACINEQCRDPCVGVCGNNARCAVIAHAAHCNCEDGYEGDAFIGCSKVITKEREPQNPCYPNPCGENALCTADQNAFRCACIEPYIGDPYTRGCQPECVYNSDCPSPLACIKQHCRDPCIGACGVYAECNVVNHVPTCSCTRGYEGDPFTGCKKEVLPIGPLTPCDPNPCGPNSICRVIEGHPTCSCQDGYFGAPPSCRPECVLNSECSQNLACINQKCVNPCMGACGFNAKCQVVNHNPICSCPNGYTGDPLDTCERKALEPVPKINACLPNPCGPNAECREHDNRAVCACLPGLFGVPPNCRPECVIDQDCPSYRACIRQRCEDPCVGACGFNALCSAQNHRASCSCIEGHEGDPYTRCNLIQIIAQKEPIEPCHPSPCGVNAECREQNGVGACICLPEYSGDPYVQCRPECVLNTDCPKNLGCINNKCRDPCPGVCGIEALCHVNNHAPTCSCPTGFTGNPSKICHKLREEPIHNEPCRPSPCGPYSQCREINGHAVCTCASNYIGTPPACRPECSINSECDKNLACINSRCVDPCVGVCGSNAICKVINHNPQCLCSQSYTGDAYSLCVPIKKEEPKVTAIVVQPCVPTPCGPYSQCREVNGLPVCTCLPNYIGRAPNCRPECTVDSECSANTACINERCSDPCPGVCGFNALCNPINHLPICLCSDGFTGDPYSGCNPIIITKQQEVLDPCNPTPCGPNTNCKINNGAGACTCLPDYFGDPYIGCRPECVANSDCTRTQSCVNNKCVDPCPGVCGRNSECRVANHQPNCYCLNGYTGNPLVACHVIQRQPEIPPTPCVPSPCGPNSQCKDIDSHAVCSCLPNLIGSPPNCRPECIVSSDCAQNQACQNQKCIDPCPGLCGSEARCLVTNHYASCSCLPGYTGDPFNKCTKIQYLPPAPEPKKDNPCVPSPCGPNSKCVDVGHTPACSCLPDYIGRPPNCRPECLSSFDCAANLACINKKCSDPCIGSCGDHTRCMVINHNPSCQCSDGYTGDPFSGCSIIPKIAKEEGPKNPCTPSPCGANAMCRERDGVGSCTCLPKYYGDPYSGCRPECVQNSDCSRSKACINNECQDPCPGVCGINAECYTLNHAPNCNCIEGYSGDPYVSCKMIEVTTIVPINACRPSPCGPYSECHEQNGHAVCSCMEGYIGAPPSCKPECVVSSECPQNLACKNKKCVDPCRNVCGSNAKCHVVNHNAHCTCQAGMTGDPFTACTEEKAVQDIYNPCVPSPCGPNSVCREIGGQAACSCVQNYIGRPPNCRPECTNNDDCQNHLTCQNERCIDPCPGSCGTNALCKVIQHNAVCLCADGYEGDPVTGCQEVTAVIPKVTVSPCEPSPCGPNAVCKERNGAGACFCQESYEGNPYDIERGCMHECEVNDDCVPQQACVRFKCIDPCQNVCGEYAICNVQGHIPTCYCPPDMTGDPFSQCKPITTTTMAPRSPCVPSPCGPNSICHTVNDQAICSCQPNFINEPPNCRPECVVSSECNPDRACVNNRCVDPCVHTCGQRAICATKNHSPICTCPADMTGDPFVQCIRLQITTAATPIERLPSCEPTPCGPNSKCQMIQGNPACSCLPDFIGSPPNCRPECVLNSECEQNKACINQRCRDPCPGSCGFDAKCHVLNHLAICDCMDGFTGDPFVRCTAIPAVSQEPIRPKDACDANPCGQNAICVNNECRCVEDYFGNPYEICRPECTLTADCPRDKSCIRNKCVDPCPGVCGINAVCEVLNHIPSCFCEQGYVGDPFRVCRVKEIEPEKKILPCSPSPCGPNSECQEVNSRAVCNCLPNYVGSPPQCRPECVVSSECSPLHACINNKCVDPCAGACGQSARCEIINHSPICGCPPTMTGDPFKYCVQIAVKEQEPVTVRDPCSPSPCGPNAVCKTRNDQPVCQCLPEFFGIPPNCRPECVINPDCPSNLACINNKCLDPCPGSCGSNAQCRVINHSVFCSCPSGYAGNAFVQCVQQEEKLEPCNPSPCGVNAQCIDRNGAAACQCIDEYQGNPYEGCRPECVLNSDCATDKACVRNKCQDPCPGICGNNAECYVFNHLPNCVCQDGYVGDAFTSCQREIQPVIRVDNPCEPSPCGPNSQCRVVNNNYVCACLDNYIGNPPYCKPECTVNSECPSNKACHNFKCANPCAGTCGLNAKCDVINHHPICSCPLGLTGDPFSQCVTPPVVAVKDAPKQEQNPCIPSPCGLYSECSIRQGQASCACLPNYIGLPPNCRPECVVNTDCSPQQACIAEKCRNPCVGACGFNSNCRVQNHIGICNCNEGFTGDPFTQCVEIVEVKRTEPARIDPCDLQPCGANTICKNGACACLANYHGDPYSGCRPECTLSTECSPNKVCMNNLCVDPCPGTCGRNALCSVRNHIPICSCPDGYMGDPFVTCHLQPAKPPTVSDFCHPNPCGSNSLCRSGSQSAICSCAPGMVGAPPACKPECLVSAECSLETTCIRKKCVDPCPGSCGTNARCQPINHNPVCSCADGYTGNPYIRCYVEDRRVQPVATKNPCVPSPCGPYSECKEVGNEAVCSCVPDVIGVPPNCRPECIVNPQCPSTKACFKQRCQDPCVGACGWNAQCSVANHVPICSCEQGYTGDPFTGCELIPAVIATVKDKPQEKNPCQPSPCGTNAVCRPNRDSYTCECISDYQGNPYEGCRPECITNSDCGSRYACQRNKCVDPCVGTCGIHAKCIVNRHIPICTCEARYTGNAFEQCVPIEIKPYDQKPDPCLPSPCGPNTNCRSDGNRAICSCLPGLIGSPTNGGCRPECAISSDCPSNMACINSKCADPCRDICGLSAQCQTINHSPICSCQKGMVGNPFVKCDYPPTVEKKDPCADNPCHNGICRSVNGVASCTYPECVINEDCARDRTCINQKCRDPCINACGYNTICSAINHKPVCSCPTGYYGNPFVECTRQVEVVPDVPKPECISDSECAADKACINSRCKNPCTELTGACAPNALCRVQQHRPICVCQDGYTGNALTNCYVLGCRSDDECAPKEACVNRQCIDPCSYTHCGVNANCYSEFNHRARCVCADGYYGNPLVGCQRHECVKHDDCPYNLECRNNRCEDPCRCGVNAQCNVINHRAQCYCPTGLSGNPLERCDLEVPKIIAECTSDSACESKRACFNGKCEDPCTFNKPCGDHTICTTIGTLPLRTLMCQCEPGYTGNPNSACKKDVGCQSHDECALSEVCRNGACVNPCIADSPCATNAECSPQQHRAVCSCPPNMDGDPFTYCYNKKTEITVGCTHDSECVGNSACINARCVDPCAEANPCAGNAECRVSNKRAICYCPEGWAGNPRIQCFKPDCISNSDCPFDKACINENCVNPCSNGNTRCGTGAECSPENHQAVCKCPLGTQGNPFISCISGRCHYNEDCAATELCDRLNRVCIPACEDDSCAVNAICRAINHQPQCQCFNGYTGNPLVECRTIVKQPDPVPVCTQDSDCAAPNACMNAQCVNPCATSNICSPQQTCEVIDTLPLRSMVCKCPDDTIADSSGYCVPVTKHTPSGCQNNEECANSEVCLRGTCIDACRLEHCGVNAQCRSIDHYGECSCPPKFIGNPHVQCYRDIDDQPKIVVAECTSNDNCAYDKTCINGRCENPCIKGCADSAFCHVENRLPVCRCPEGYVGDPQVKCTPPPLLTNIGCKSNSDCPSTEACINTQCLNPCNCGRNAECQIRDHHPICYCKPGYSGNAQIGCEQIECQSDSQCALTKQCVNEQCVNPCYINDPCAINAECFADNHRANCRCPPGLEGDAYVRCIYLECRSDYECAANQMCRNNQCIDACSESACAQTAICRAYDHRAVCLCPEEKPLGNPHILCEARAKDVLCTTDASCPSRLACINNQCQDPCSALTPCKSSARCSVLDSVPMRTMVCECLDNMVPNAYGECTAIVLKSTTPGCVSDHECPDVEACINRVCRNPCNCGLNSVCKVRDHHATCYCQDGYAGNPLITCRTIGCRTDLECEMNKACVQGNCINTCLVNNPCAANAECYVQSNKALCRCRSGYRGNPYELCRIVHCTTNSDCASDKMCRNEHCVDPCVYDNACATNAECRAQNHLAVCHCATGYVGNPYIDCRAYQQPICQIDADCPSTLACINEQCVEACAALEPCERPAQCEVKPTAPVRTFICICPEGYISTGSGTCKPTTSIAIIGGCVSDGDCSTDKACVNGICRNPCACGYNAECRVKNHKPVCTCRQGYEGTPELECTKVECTINSDCPATHACRNHLCVSACQGETCGSNAQCAAIEHRGICECLPGYHGNPRLSCTPIGCRNDNECPSSMACVNSNCVNPCDTTAVCAQEEICKVYQHQTQCICAPGYVYNGRQCEIQRDIPICQYDNDCPLENACIRGECVNPCTATEPCGVNAVCRVLNTIPVRTMICECLEGYTGNAAIQCDKRSLCAIEKGFVRNADGQCVCPPGAALDIYEYCSPCVIEQGYKIDETGHCVCALERGMVIDEHGYCICPIDHGYYLTADGECLPKPECEVDADCADSQLCNLQTRSCEDACVSKVCGVNAFCKSTNHRGQCQCITGYTGNPDIICNHTNFRTDFPRPDMVVSCLADGVQVEIHITEPGFNGVLYVKGHSKDEACRRVVNLAGESVPRTEIFRVTFGTCGMQAVQDIASFVLVIQKHPKLVTYKAQAYNIKCVYQTGEKNVTLGFNVSMLTTAGTIANTGPPPICQMRIVTNDGQEISSAEIGDKLQLQVDVEPATIYGGFARSCIAKTMEDNVENEYIVTDENGCATDVSIFEEWEFNPDTNSLLASFNAFKFPSSDNIRFQCNIRVCFGKCQPVNCHGYNAFGRRRRRDVSNDTSTAVAIDQSTEGQLREEIIISSNAILTFEKRIGQGINEANIKPAAQRVEDICVSMVGLIIALVITALLALVAVAVAVSCWLMAYRRRPKTLTPLPHPPEFPNPLFANMESVAEPTPDYIS